ncbi:hypothetical protein K438DRAFT_1773576 [Mycena galopus ATCC 62051]|nr:hypothetical protein K438DRAFT_1773576 [Mycena galopus ATCC 62051]
MFDELLRAGSAEMKTEGGYATMCIFATRSILANRKIRPGGYIRRKAGVMKPGMNGEGKEVGKQTEDGDRSNMTMSNANPICRSMPQSGVDTGFEGEVLLLTRPEVDGDFPSTNVGAGKPGSASGNGNGRKGEGKPDGMPEQLLEEGTEGTEDAGKDVLRSIGWSARAKQDSLVGSSPELCPLSPIVSGIGNWSRNELKDWDKPEEPIVPEVVSANPLEESRGGSELVKGPEEDELAE